MSKRKPLDKAEARARRDRMLASAAEATLSLTDGVREMRAIAGMTQEEFAHHRGVGARVVKAIELGQGNPTVATLNRIGEFFGLEVAFVPVRRPEPAQAAPVLDATAIARHFEDALEHKIAVLIDTMEKNLQAKLIDALGQRAASGGGAGEAPPHMSTPPAPLAADEPAPARAAGRKRKARDA